MSEGRFMAQEQSAQLDEAALVQRRLDELTDEALRGEHTGTSVRFFAALEREHLFATTEEVERALQDPDSEVAQFFGKIPESFRPLTPGETEVALAEFHRDALAEIEALTPQNPFEESRKQRWLETIPRLNSVRDVIGYRICQEFSTPTLGSSTPPADANCEELAAAEEENARTGNWVEYRFGDAPGEGWYDMPEVNEYQLTPCSPSEAARREPVIEQRIEELGAQLGCLSVAGGPQWNLSAYEQAPLPRSRVQFEKDGDGKLTKAKVQTSENRALIGTLDGREETTLRTLAGTLASISDGAWMNSGEVRAERREVEGSYRAYRVASSKGRGVNIRVAENRYELRTGFFGLSTRQNLLWMMSGVLDGLRNGQSLLNDRRIPHPWVDYGTKITFDERLTDTSWEMARILLTYKAHPDNGILRYKKGDPLSARSQSTRILEDLVLPCVRVARRGALYTSKRAIDEVYEGALKEGNGDILYPPETLRALVSKCIEGLRFVKEREVEGLVYFDHMPPRARFQTMLGSSAMRIAFGRDHADYVKHLEESTKNSG